jgi:hypothetical protein
MGKYWLTQALYGTYSNVTSWRNCGMIPISLLTVPKPIVVTGSPAAGRPLVSFANCELAMFLACDLRETTIKS